MLSWWPQSLCSCFLAWGSSCQSPQRLRLIKVGGLVKGHCGSLIARGDEHSIWLCNLANTVVGRGHGGWCAAYDESEQVLQITTEVTRQQCCLLRMAAHQCSDVSCGPLAAGPQWALDEAEAARLSGVGTVPLRMAQMMGQQKTRKGPLL